MFTEFYVVNLDATMFRFSTSHYRYCHLRVGDPNNPHCAAIRELAERFKDHDDPLSLSEKDARTFCNYYSIADVGKFLYFYQKRDAELFLDDSTIYQTFLSIPGFL